MAPISDGYPVVLRLEGRRVLVVGPISELAEAGRIDLVQRAYEHRDLDGVQLVIVSTDDAATQLQVFADCQARGIWCNAADDPDNCSFILPAVARRGPVIVAVSTQGSSPALAGVLRDIVADALPANVEAVAAQLGGERSAMRAQGRSTESVDWRPRVRALLSSRPPQQLARVDKSDTSFAFVEEAVDDQDQG
jgi:siroheme synthase (precorrin-2 oxidase/ferrochelatase)